MEKYESEPEDVVSLPKMCLLHIVPTCQWESIKYPVCKKKPSAKYNLNSYSSHKPIATKLIHFLQYITERKFADSHGNRQKRLIGRNYYVKNTDF